MQHGPERAALEPSALRHALLPPRGGFARVDVVTETGSTNADLVAAAADGAPDRTVLVAEYQAAGRGRAGRSWQAPSRSGLFFSVLLRPDGVARDRWGWLPLLAGVAVCDVLGRLAGVEAVLKWPNDVLLGPGRGKGAGILSEVVGHDAVVLGIGCNVSTRADELPVAGATSLAVEQARCSDRERLLVALLQELDTRGRDWLRHGGGAESSGLADDYRRRCATLGQQVRVTLPGQPALLGRAVDVDGQGRLLLDALDGLRALSAGEITHLRS